MGSKDKVPRDKRTKLQCHVERSLGVARRGKKDLCVDVQEPCQTCGSCMRVRYEPPNPQHNSQAISFVTRAFSDHIQSEPT
jgi:hypothetical protein